MKELSVRGNGRNAAETVDHNDSGRKVIDPRTLRTRRLLQRALTTLLETADFESISVQDITEIATVNRATFYDHYPDKFALLESIIRTRFLELLTKRGAKFDGRSPLPFRAIVLSVHDCLADFPSTACKGHRQIDAYVEFVVIEAVREMILDAAKCQVARRTLSAEIIATTVSSAIYGAAKEWCRTAPRRPSSEIVEPLVTLFSPLLYVGTACSRKDLGNRLA
jgi:AcrR family transcriptional regulator